MRTIRFESIYKDEDIRKALREQGGVSEEIRKGLKKASRVHRVKTLVYGAGFAVVGILMAGWGVMGTGLNLLGQIVFTGAGVGLALLFPVLALIEVIRSATHGPRKDPESLTRSFYEDVMCSGVLAANFGPDFAKALKLLAPSVIGPSTLEETARAWEALRRRVKEKVGRQEDATCEVCGREEHGLWSVRRYNPYLLEDDYIRSQKLRFLKCPSCAAVICGPCYLETKKEGLTRKRRCPKCEKKLDGDAPIFFTEPEIEMNAEVGEVTVEEGQAGPLAHVRVTIEAALSLTEKNRQRYGERTWNMPLGDRGHVTLQFRNTAVKIGEEWFLAGATPGREVL